MNKSVKLTLVASLVVNALLIGVLLGQLPRRFEHGSSPLQRLETAAEKLPEPGRSQVHAALKQMRGEIDPLRARMEKSRDQTIGIFVADRFDEASYDQHVNEIGDLRLQIGRRMAATLKAIARDLPPDQRKMLARAFDRSPRPR